MAWIPTEKEADVLERSLTASAPYVPTDDEAEGVASPVEESVSALHTGDVVPPDLPESISGKLSSYITRLMKAHNPFPTSLEDIKGALSPTPGKVGMGRFLEEEGKRVGKSVRAVGRHSAEDLVQLPGFNKFPEASAAYGAGSSAALDLISDSLTPSAMAQNVGAEAGLSALKGGELALRGRLAEKVSGLPPHVARAVRENPEFFEVTKGTPEAQDAANKAIQDILEEAHAGHITKTTADREAARVGELGDVEAGVRDIQKVIKDTRRNAGSSIQAEKQKLGFTPLDEQAKLISERGLPPKMDDAELIREAMGLLRDDAPRGPDSIEPLVNLRQAIDDRINFGSKDINPPGTKMGAILKDMRAKINERIGGPMEGDIERSAMGVPTGNHLPDTYAGAPLRAAEKEFSRVARITDPLTKKFDTVPRGVSSVKSSMQEGLRSVDPELRALDELAGGGEALARAEGAESKFLENEKTFKQGLKKFDPITGKFETTPKGMETVRNVMREGTEAIDPDMKTIKGLPKGEESLSRMKAEVNRFDADRVDVKPDGATEMVAQVLGITPRRAARLLSQSVHAGPFPGLSRAAMSIAQASAQGPQKLSVMNYLRQQQDPEYRAAIQALQEDESK